MVSATGQELEDTRYEPDAVDEDSAEEEGSRGSGVAVSLILTALTSMSWCRRLMTGRRTPPRKPPAWPHPP